MTEFRRRGWHDVGGTAVAVVRALEESDRGLSPQRAAAVVGTEFVTVNHVSRTDVEEMLVRLADTAA